MPSTLNVSWTQKYFKALMKYNGIHPDTFTEAQQTEIKLLKACLEGKNSLLYVCEDMPLLIENGRVLDNFTRQHGRVISDDFPFHQGFNFSRPTAIFTEPHSENYCIQSLYLKHIVPEPRPVHGYPSVDIMQILKLRLDEDTFLCVTSFPDFFTNEDIAERMLWQMRPRNTSLPIVAVYNTIINLTQTAAYQNVSLNISMAANEVYKVRIMNVTSAYNFSSAIVMSHLQNVPDVYVRIGTEPNRMQLADSIKDLDVMRRLMVVGRVNHFQIRKLFKIFNEHIIENDDPWRLCKVNATLTRPINYQDIIFSPETFEDLSESQIGLLNFMMQSAHINATIALRFLDEYSIELLSFYILKDCNYYSAKHIISEFEKYHVPHNLNDMALCKAQLNQSGVMVQLGNYFFIDKMSKIFDDKEPEIKVVLQLLMYTIAIAFLLALISKNTLLSAPIKYVKQRFFSPRNDSRTRDEAIPLMLRVQHRTGGPEASTIKIAKKQ